MAKSFELPQYSSSSPLADTLFAAMLHTESGNRQLTAQGTPVTSPKGAVGVAQVMPGTAPEAAKLAGLEWDEQRYRQDSDYNAALGKAYFNKQVATFGGDTNKAMAAYNAGPGRVKQAEQQALEQGGLWTDYLPQETKDYLQKNNAQAGSVATPTAGGSIPAVSVAQPIGESLDQMLAPVSLGDQKRQQLAQTTATKQGNLDPVSTLNTDQTSLSEFLRQYANGDPAQSLQLIASYRSAKEKAAAAKQAQEDKYWAKTDDRGTFTGDAINMAAGIYGTLNTITAQMANLGNNHDTAANIKLASDAAKQAYPVVKAFEAKTAEYEQQKRLIHENDKLSDGEKRLQLARIDSLQSRLTPPTDAQYQALETATTPDQYGQGLLPGIVKPGFKSNAVFDTAPGAPTNREALDAASAALGRSRTVQRAFDQGKIYNPNYNRDEFHDSIQQINQAHAADLNNSWQGFTQNLEDGNYGTATLEGAGGLVEGGSWLADQMGNAIEHPAGVRDYAVEMSPYLAAGALHPGILATLNTAYGQEVTQNAIAYYQKQHNGKLPTNGELATMVQAGTAAAVLEYIGEMGILKGVKQFAGKEAGQSVLASAMKNLKGSLATNKLVNNPLTRSAAAATEYAAKKATPVVESYLKEGFTEGGQTYMEEDVSKLNGDTPSWKKIAMATAIGGAAGGGTVVGMSSPALAADVLKGTVKGTQAAAEKVTQTLNQKTEQAAAETVQANTEAADTTLGDYKATLAQVPDAAAYQAMTPEAQQQYKEQLTQHSNTLGAELDGIIATLETEQRKPTEPEKARARELSGALKELETAYNQIAPVSADVTPEEVTLATQPAAETQDPAPVITAAQKVLFNMLQQPESVSAETSQALADNSTLPAAQRAVAASAPVSQQLTRVLSNGNSVHNEILNGSAQNKGVLSYIRDVQQAIEQQDTQKAARSLQLLEQFKNRHQAKLDAGYNGGEHRADIKQQMQVEVAALNLAHKQLTELAVAHLPQLAQSVTTQADPQVQIQQAIDQAKAALAQYKNTNQNSSVIDVNGTLEQAKSNINQPDEFQQYVNDQGFPDVSDVNDTNVADTATPTVATVETPVNTTTDTTTAPLTGYAQRVSDRLQQISNATQPNDIARILKQQYTDNEQTKETTQQVEQLAQTRRAALQKSTGSTAQVQPTQTSAVETEATVEPAVKAETTTEAKPVAQDREDTQVTLAAVQEAHRQEQAKPITEEEESAPVQEDAATYHHGTALLEAAKDKTIGQRFVIKPAKTLFHQVRNLISKLDNPEHVLAQEAKAMLSTEEHRALGDYLVHVKDVITKLPAMLKLDGAYHDQNNLHNLFEDFVTVDQNGQPQLDENLMAQIGSATFAWLATMGGMTLRNLDEDINKLLGRDTKSEVKPEERAAYANSGKLSNNVVEDLGTSILAQLPIRPDPTKATPYDIAYLRTALGTMAAMTLLEQGHLEERWVRVTTTKDAEGIEHKSYETFQGDTAPAPAENSVVERYFRAASQTVTKYGMQREVLTPVLQDIRNSFKLLQPFMTEVLGSEATIDTVYQKAEDVPAYKTDSHGQPLATRQAEALTTHSARPNRIKTDMMKLLQALPGQMLPMLLGAVPQVDMTVAEARRDSVRSANEGILREIEQLFTSFAELGDKPFFFKHSVAVNKRMHMQSQTVNPQASKLHRHAITMDDQVTEVHWTDQTEREQFQIAVAEAFGAKIGNNNLQYGIDFFNQLIKDPTIQAGVAAVQAILNSKADQDSYSDLMAAVELGGESIYSLDGLLALAKMTTDKPFTSDLPRKVDGVTNGTSIGLLQLVGAKSYAAIRNMLARTGIFLDSNETSYGHWYNQPGNNDCYQDLTARMLDYFHNAPFTANNNTVLDQLRRRTGIDFFFNTQQFISKKDGKINSAGRKLAKHILMPSNYGASLRKLVDNLSDSLVDNIYQAIEQAVLNEDTNQLQAIELQVKHMLGEQASLFTLNHKNPLATVISPQATKVMHKLVQDTYGEAVKQSLHDGYSEHKRHAALINDATHLAFNAFQALYDRKTKLMLVEKRQADPNYQLTVADIKQALKELKPVSPMIATAMSNLVQDGQAIEDGINLVRQIKERQVGKGAERQRNAVSVTTKRLSGDKAGKDRKLTMYVYQDVFKDPGVSPAVLLIQSLDASTMVELLREHGVLNVHDAAIMNSSQTEEITPFFNKVFLRLNQQYSMLSATQNMLERTLAAYRETTGDKQLKKLKFHGNYMKTLAGLPVTPTIFESLFKEAATQIEQNRQLVLSRIQSVVQYNAENGAYVPTKDADLTEAQLAEILDGLAMDSADVADEFQPLPWNTVYGSKTKLEDFSNLESPAGPDPEAQQAIEDGVDGDTFLHMISWHQKEFPYDQILAEKIQQGTSAAELIQILQQHPGLGKVRQVILNQIAHLLPANLDIQVVPSPEAAFKNGQVPLTMLKKRYIGLFLTEDPQTKRPTVYLAGNKFRFSGLNPQTILHELVHAATLVLMYNEQKKPAAERSVEYRNLERLYQHAQRALPQFSYRMMDIFEFVAEAHSNVAFAHALAGVKIAGSQNGNLYSRFMQTIAKLMGLFKNGSTETNLLFEVMAATEALTNQQAELAFQPISAPQRATQFAQRIQDVTRNNAQLIFDELSKTNAVPVNPIQQNQLQSILDLTLPLLDKAKLYLRNRVGETAVHADILKQRVVVDIGLQAATAGISLSNQEAYLQGLLKVILDNKLNSQHPATRQLQAIYDHAANTLTAKDFLADPVQAADPVLMAQAQARYDYLFRSGASQTKPRQSAYIGTEHQDAYSDHLHTFVAMALTNPQLRQSLGKLSSKLPQSLGKQGKSSAQWLFDLVQTLISTMSGRLDRRPHPTLDGHIQELVGRLAGVDNRAGAKLYKAIASVNDAMEQQVEKVVQHVTQSFAQLAGSKAMQNSKARVVRTSSKAAHLLLNGQGPALATAMQKSLDRAKVLKRGLLASNVQEMLGNTERRKDLYRLLQKRVKLVDILRQDTLTKYSKHLTKMFKTPLDSDTNQAVTRVMARLDFTALVDHYGLAKAIDLLRTPAQRLAEIQQLKRTLLAQPNGQYYVNQADNLGYFMVHMQGKFEHVMRNAHAIVQLAGTGKPAPTGDMTQTTQQVDLLASLYAQEYADRADQAKVLALLDNELDPTDIDNVDTGIAAVLHTLRDLKQRSLKELFHGNPMQMQKGYVRETFDPHVEIVVADAVEGADLEKLGFVKGEQVIQDSAMATVHTKPLFYYSIDNSGNTHYRTGVLSLSGVQARGTDLLSVNKQAGHIDPALGAYTDKLLLQRNKQASIDALFRAPGKPVKGSSLQPVLDDQGNVSTYVYLMTEQKRRDWKKRNDDFRLVLGTSMASLSDKQESQKLNREILDTLYQDHQKNYSKEPYNFVALSSKAKDKAFRDAYQMIASDTRRYAKQLWGSDVLYVREDQFQLLFGYRPLAVSNLRFDRRTGLHGSEKAIQVANNALATLMNNQFGRTATLVWQELVHMSKDNIVIKSLDVTLNNVISNIILLKISNVPMKDIIKDTAIAYRGAIEYQRHSQQLFDIKQALERGTTGTKRAELLNEQRNLQQKMRNNPVRELIEEGVLQSIVEDVDTVDDMYTYKSRLEEKLGKMGKYVPKPLALIGKTVLMHHSTPLYKIARDFAMLSDFSARYALHKYNTQTRKQKMSAADSIADIMETFVNYETPTHKVLQFLNDHDPVMFTKYLLRTQKVIAKLVQKHPAQLIMMALLQQIWGDLPDVTDSLMGVSSIHKFTPSPTSLLDGLTNSFAVNALVK